MNKYIFDTELKKIKLINEGSYSQIFFINKKMVWKKYIKIDNEINAIKLIYYKTDKKWHENLIDILAFSINENNISGIILPFGINLSKLDYLKLDINLIKFNLKKIFELIKYLHSLNICHRDIKLENVLYINENFKLIDFGLTKEFDKINTCEGTYSYFHPIMIKKFYKNEKPNKNILITNDLFALFILMIKIIENNIYLDQKLFYTINDSNLQNIFWKEYYVHELNSDNKTFIDLIFNNPLYLFI